MKISKFKVDNGLLTLIIVLAGISIITLWHAKYVIDPKLYDNFEVKQAVWYAIGFVGAYFVMFIGTDLIYRNAFLLYALGVLSLIVLMLAPPSIARPINDTKAWFQFPGGSIQPSEFVKIFIIILNAKIIHHFNESNLNPSVRDEFFLIVKIAIVALIPSIFIFIQPDTGLILIIALICLSMLYASGIRRMWFIIFFGISGVVGTVIFYLAINDPETLLPIFGDFAYRIRRIVMFAENSSYQLEHGLRAMGSGGLLGHGFGNVAYGIPFGHTDFIFTVFGAIFGYVGVIILFFIFITLDVKILQIGFSSYKRINRYTTAGILGMLLYQQVQNIGMCLGLLPITGITLPFISYGGSSLLSFMLIIGILFTISNEQMRYRN